MLCIALSPHNSSSPSLNPKQSLSFRSLSFLFICILHFVDVVLFFVVSGKFCFNRWLQIEECCFDRFRCSNFEICDFRSFYHRNVRISQTLASAKCRKMAEIFLENCLKRRKNKRSIKNCKLQILFRKLYLIFLFIKHFGKTVPKLLL